MVEILLPLRISRETLNGFGFGFLILSFASLSVVHSSMEMKVIRASEMISIFVLICHQVESMDHGWIASSSDGLRTVGIRW